MLVSIELMLGWAACSTYLIYEGRHDPELGELGSKVLDTLGAGDQVQEENTLLRNASRLEHIDGHDGRSS